MHTQQQRLERTVLFCRLQACQQVKNHITVAVQDTDVRRLKRKPKLKKREGIMVFASLHTPPRVNSTMVVNHYEVRALFQGVTSLRSLLLDDSMDSEAEFYKS